MSFRKKTKLEKEPNSKVEELSESVKEFEEARRKADERHKRKIEEEISVIYSRPGGAEFIRELGFLIHSIRYQGAGALTERYDAEYNKLKMINYLLRSGLSITFEELNKLTDYQLIMLVDIEQQKNAQK